MVTRRLGKTEVRSGIVGRGGGLFAGGVRLSRTRKELRGGTTTIRGVTFKVFPMVSAFRSIEIARENIIRHIKGGGSIQGVNPNFRNIFIEEQNTINRLKQLSNERVNKEKQRIEQERKNKISLAIQEKNKKIIQTKDVFQKSLIQQQTKTKINQINQTAIQLKQQFIQKAKKISGKITTKLSQSTKIKLIRAFDNISGGSVTERILNQRDVKLNSDIEKFNKDFGGKELSEKEFKKAKKQEKSLDSRRKNINNEKEVLANSLKRRIKIFVFGKPGGTRIQISEKGKAQNRKFIKQNKEKIKRLEKNKPNFYKLRIGDARRRIKFLEDQNRLGGQVLLGDLPLVPASAIPKGITSIKFLGKQKTLKNGKVVTDIIFKTSKGNVGIAKGISVQKGSQGQSIVLGRFAKQGVKFPSTKIKLGRARSFVSVEKTLSKPVVFKLKKTMQLISRGKKLGNIKIIKANLNGLRQAGIGRSGVVRGKRFFRTSIRFPSGKISRRAIKGIDFDDFASLSNVMTKKEISIIVGNSISGKGAKARFIGIIKGTSKAGKSFSVSGVQKQQYSKAIQKVISATSSALAQAEQTTRGVSKLGVLAKASNILSKSVSVRKPISRVITRTRIKQVTIKTPSQKIITKQVNQIKQKIKGVRTAKATQIRKGLQKVKVLQVQQTKITQRTKQLQRQSVKARTTQKTKQLQRQIQKQRQKVTQLQRQITKQLSRATSILNSINIRALKLIIPIIRIKIKGFKGKKLSKSQPVFYVKEKVRGKIKNLTPRPLTLRMAKDFLAYRLDNRLSRSGWFEPIGKSKNVVVVPKVMRGYFNKHRKKFRAFKIRVGKRKKIRNGFIEKKKYVGDTKSEIKQLQASRRKRKPLKRKIKRVKKRRIVKRRPIRKRVVRRTVRKVRRRVKKRLSPIERRKQKLINENARIRKSIKKRKIKKRVIRKKVKRRKVKRKTIKRRKRK